MKDRCTNVNNIHFDIYGGRGISVCPDWAENFLVFKDWAESNGWKQGLFLDRIDNDKGYCPDNCRFVSVKESNRNKRSVVERNYFGQMLTYAEAAAIYGVHKDTIRYRILNGVTPNDAVKKTPKGEYLK